MAEPVHRSIRDGIAVIEIDSPPDNALALSVRRALSDALARSEAEPEVRAIVITARGASFSAGIEPSEIGQKPQDPQLHELVDRIEAAAKPVVVAIQGDALGGGFEIALAAHRRIMAASARIGLPEIQLGLLPGAGGTQRLPRLIGLPAALALIASGRLVGATEAKQLRLVDEVAQDDLLAGAIRIARSLVGKMQPRLSLRPPPPVSGEEWESAVARVKREARGKIAPLKAIDLIHQVQYVPYSIGIPAERHARLDLLASDQSRALRYLFDAERRVSLPSRLPETAPPAIRNLGIAGSGMTALGLALIAAEAGISVVMAESGDLPAPSMPERLAAFVARAARMRGWTSARQMEIAERVRFARDYSALRGAEIVLEAAPDDGAARADLLIKLEEAIAAEAVLATTTGTGEIIRLAEARSRPERFGGLHVLPPVLGARIAEIGCHPLLSGDALFRLFGFCRQIGKMAILTEPRGGSVGARMLARFRAQCEFMLEEGAMPAEIDRALEAYGLALGPFAAQDLAGIDSSRSRRRRLAATRAAEERDVPLAEMLCALGHTGQKAGRGWYRYENGQRLVDPDVEALIRDHARGTGRRQISHSPAMIQRRILAALVNEGAKLLDEKVVLHPYEIDLVMVYGHGFPAYRGGPMHEADQIGLRGLSAELEASAARDGPSFAISDLFVSLARSGSEFAALNEPTGDFAGVAQMATR